MTARAAHQAAGIGARPFFHGLAISSEGLQIFGRRLAGLAIGDDFKGDTLTFPQLAQASFKEMIGARDQH